ncbi:BTAD domain-containing putative transcriptional regulator [Streptomonospora wellingtoniae]|uniref:BTAD domain-containing putative transcriptional regulator n=1 Tax=Streptomonospora wellingtoniae TaxID=3075544 RepID=A0ABU2L095_9ACTN|nr:BTAD domain-containing putative transcriptional regulator [Streptomonospora sp. DSM 45055]MDT0304969.1 BTAD domain-containing putative transcriptional regulator [Streptomonospora sp. DSM 45055]
MTGDTDDAAAVRFAVLGPLEAAGPSGAVALKGPRQRALLARLLVAGGRVVPVQRLVEDLWPAQAPDGAVAAIRTFVADLRRALEPGRPPRSPARLLATAAPGYVLRAAPGAVDAGRFEAGVARGRALLVDARPGPALEELERSLQLWRGPAYAEFAEHPWARGAAERLEEVRLAAAEHRAEALIGSGRAAEAAADLRAHVGAHPLREDAWHHLALALYRSGRQGDALAALRRARRTLAEELGVDPGERLRTLEADILAQAPRLSPRPREQAPPPSALPPPTAAPAHPLLGRAGETGELERAADRAERGGTVAALVAGGAGAGKTALARDLAARLSGRGWITAWGECPEHEGAPPAWTWERIAAALEEAAPAPAAPAEPAGEDTPRDPAAARFQALGRAAALVEAAARRAPVLLVADDLHRADEETLELLAGLAAHPGTRPVLVVGTYRSDAITPALTRALARLARREPLRLYLDGLSLRDTGRVVAGVAGRAADEATAAAIHRRSGGNPFYVRELARLYADQGARALDDIPPGVGDLIRHRLAGLDPAARRLVGRASVIGRDVDCDVLAAVAEDGADGGGMLDALDSALQAGFLTEPGPRRLRFSHVLVRDAVYTGLSGPRRARWHGAAARALERLRPGEAASLAHHFARADIPGADERAAAYAREAARRAEARFAPHESARLWRAAAAACERSGAPVRTRLEAVMGMVRGLAVTGRLEEARAHRGRAVEAAAGLEDPELLGRVVTAFDVPALWPRNDDEDLSARVAGAAQQALSALEARTPDGGEELRCRLLVALALELRGDAGRRGPAAARRAEALARRRGGAALLCAALNARFMQSFHTAGGARLRAGIGAELIEVASGAGLVAYEVLGRLVQMQAHGACADFCAADAHAAAVGELGDRYEIGHVAVFTGLYAAVRAAAAGRFADAESAYRAAAAPLAGSGMPGLAQGAVPLARLCLRLQPGGPAHGPGGHADLTGSDWGPYAPWALPLLGTGEAASAAPPPAPAGLLNEALTCLDARSARACGDQDRMRRAYERLLPAADELAGAGSGLVVLGPVAHHLGGLARDLGRESEAVGHYRRARAVADQAGAPHWRGAAERELYARG